jgi:Anti-sigma factor NepR
MALSFQDDKDGARRRKSGQNSEIESSKSTRPRKRSEGPQVGDALRSVYDRALREDIPSEMLDLLKKLG